MNKIYCNQSNPPPIKTSFSVFNIFVGRRTCLGEQLSRMEMFLLLANLFHNYSFTFPEDEPDPPVEAESHGMSLLFPKSYKLCPQQRL